MKQNKKDSKKGGELKDLENKILNEKEKLLQQIEYYKRLIELMDGELKLLPADKKLTLAKQGIYDYHTWLNLTLRKRMREKK